MSEDDILFEITKDHLETGMRGFPIGYCPTSFVDPEKGLFYAGQSIHDLATWEPREVIYLLLHGHQGTSEEIKAFFQELRTRESLNSKTIKAIYALPREGHPMKLFSAAILILGMLEGGSDYKEDCLNIIAKIPHLVACVINHHAGWGETPAPKADLGYMDNFAHMLKKPELAELFKLFNVLHYDHGGGNLSTFVGKAVASGLEDMYGSLSSSMCALAGPRHGKANQDCLAFVKLLEKEGIKSADEVEGSIRKRLANKELVFGFGHAVLRVEDPRATLFYAFAQDHFPMHPLVKIALNLRERGVKVLQENAKISNPYPNVDAISGVCLAASGFDYPEYFTVLFGLSRCIGISAQVVYERCDARNGKGTPIIRPKYIYKPR